MTRQGDYGLHPENEIIYQCKASNADSQFILLWYQVCFGTIHGWKLTSMKQINRMSEEERVSEVLK